MKITNENKIREAFNNINWSDMIDNSFEKYLKGFRTDVCFDLITGEVDIVQYSGNTILRENCIRIFTISPNFIVNCDYQNCELYTEDEIIEINRLIENENVDKDIALNMLGISYEDRCIDVAIIDTKIEDLDCIIEIGLKKLNKELLK